MKYDSEIERLEREGLFSQVGDAIGDMVAEVAEVPDFDEDFNEIEAKEQKWETKEQSTEPKDQSFEEYWLARFGEPFDASMERKRDEDVSIDIKERTYEK